MVDHAEADEGDLMEQSTPVPEPDEDYPQDDVWKQPGAAR